MDLKEILNNEPNFREQQVEKAIFQDLIADWEKASNLPKNLVEKLTQQLPLEITADVLVSKKENSIKAIIKLKDELLVEAVLMRHKSCFKKGCKERNTVCVSSQVGCSMGCLFCLTGQKGLKRNLTVWEIISQVLFFARFLKAERSERSQRITNVVFMGMGEPLLNYDNVIEAINILNKKNGLGISQRKISISTVGIPWAIKKLAKEDLKINLAISLHSAIQSKRAKLMPIAKNHNLEELYRAIDFYIKATKQRVLFEYLMLKGVNDSDKDALELAKFIKQFKIPKGFRAGKNFYFVNLIAFNNFKSQNVFQFEAPSPEKILMFKKTLAFWGIDCVQRFKFGEDIKGSCGQLVYDVKHKL